MKWEKDEFDERFKGWLNDGTLLEYQAKILKSFISSLLEEKDKEFRKVLKGLKVKVEKPKTYYDYWSLPVLPQEVADGFNMAVYKTNKLWNKDIDKALTKLKE